MKASRTVGTGTQLNCERQSNEVNKCLQILVWAKASAVTKQCRVSLLHHQFAPVLFQIRLAMLVIHKHHWWSYRLVFGVHLQELEQKRALQAAETQSSAVEAELEGLSAVGRRSPVSPADIKAKNTGQCEGAKQPQWVQFRVELSLRGIVPCSSLYTRLFFSSHQKTVFLFNTPVFCYLSIKRNN